MNSIELDVMKKLLEALMWTSGSSDFAFPDGTAVVGWKKLCVPAIDNAMGFLKEIGEWPIGESEEIDE